MLIQVIFLRLITAGCPNNKIILISVINNLCLSGGRLNYASAYLNSQDI